MEKFATWLNTFSIDFENESEKSAKENLFNIGEEVSFRTSWMLKFSQLFPVEFYIDSCLVESSKSGLKYEIVKNGCPSPLVNARTETVPDTKQIAVQYKVIKQSPANHINS